MAEQMVGLIAIVHLPGVGFRAILKERGMFNFDTMKPETWPGVCQVTVLGRVNDGENLLTALLRETAEELGVEFAFSLATQITADSTCLTSMIYHGKDEKTITTFAVRIEVATLMKARLALESGTIRLISQKDIEKIINIAKRNKTIGAIFRQDIVMFPDAKESLVRAFAFVQTP